MKPFALQMTAVMAATISPAAQAALETHFERGRRMLRGLVRQYLTWLRSEAGRSVPPAQAQSRFTIVRLRFNAVLSQFDIFADVLVQRSEHGNGVWISGLDAVAADALALPGYYETPPVICYLDRGHGAAIRRARTRLPGGGENPVAVIRVPRERMVGSGIASSLVHEVGHQAAALLDLINSMRRALQQKQRETGPGGIEWVVWERWISEILADFWSVAKVGVASTLGLIGVVSLPRAFVFRINLDDPHPFPWIRLKLSCAMGRALYPHSQWDRLEAIWESFYPVKGLDEERKVLVEKLQGSIPEFIDLLVNHRPRSLRGRALADVLSVTNHQPSRLAALHKAWERKPSAIRFAKPSLAFAVIGQARADEKISPEAESRLIGDLLTHWALHGSLGTSAMCAARTAAPVPAPAT